MRDLTERGQYGTIFLVPQFRTGFISLEKSGSRMPVMGLVGIYLHTPIYGVYYGTVHESGNLPISPCVP